MFHITFGEMDSEQLSVLLHKSLIPDYCNMPMYILLLSQVKEIFAPEMADGLFDMLKLHIVLEKQLHILSVYTHVHKHSKFHQINQEFLKKFKHSVMSSLTASVYRQVNST